MSIVCMLLKENIKSQEIYKNWNTIQKYLKMEFTSYSTNYCSSPRYGKYSWMTLFKLFPTPLFHLHFHSPFFVTTPTLYLKVHCVRFRGILVASSSEVYKLQPADSLSVDCLQGFYPEPNYPKRSRPLQNKPTRSLKQVKTITKAVSCKKKKGVSPMLFGMAGPAPANVFSTFVWSRRPGGF